MKQFVAVLLVLHIISGTIALATGLFSMFNRKGGKQHRLTGKLFFWSMTGVFITAVSISIAKSLLFLFMVGFFSYYLTCSGYRSLYLKKLPQGQKPEAIDWLISISGLLFGGGLVVYAIVGFISNGKLFSLVPLVFGMISFALAYADVRKFYTRPKDTLYWMVSHGMRMSGGFTAAVTAFVVVNIHIRQEWILWLLPTAVIPPVTMLYIKQIKKKPAEIINAAKIGGSEPLNP